MAWWLLPPGLLSKYVTRQKGTQGWGDIIYQLHYVEVVIQSVSRYCGQSAMSAGTALKGGVTTHAMAEHSRVE